jgi:hypothetical protein
VSFFSAIKSLFGVADESISTFDEAQKFSIYAPFFMLAIEGATKGKLSAFKWIVKEQQFAACYMIGFSLALGKSKPTEEQGIFALNIAFQIFKELFATDSIDLDEDSKHKISKAFYEYLFQVDVHDDEDAFEMGLADAQKHLNEQTNLPRGLVAHFQSSF